MGIGLIIAGFVFLVNPCYSVIDFLPDFIGFFLIFKGLSKTSSLDGRLTDSRDIFFRLGMIDLSKLVFMYLYVMGSTSNPVDSNGIPLDAASVKESQATYLLIATFVYAVIEVIFFIGAVNALHDGFDGLGRRFPSKSVNAQRIVSKDKNGVAVKRDVSVIIKYVTIAFFIVRSALSVLCELPALWMSSHYGYVTSGPTAERLKPSLYILSSVIVVVLGAVFLFFCIRYWNSVRRDAAFIAAMKAAYGTFNEENPTVKLGKRMKMIEIFFLISCFLSIRITTGEMAVFPGVFCAVFLMVTAFLMRDFFKNKAWFFTVMSTSLVYGAASTVFYIYETKFFRENHYSRLEVFRLNGARKLYPPVAIWGTVEGVFLAFSVIVLAFVFFRVSKSHVSIAGEEFHVSDKITFRVDKYRDELRSSLRRRRRIAITAGFIHFAFRIFLPVFEPYVFLLFPPTVSGGVQFDTPGQVMSYLTFTYFVLSALWIVALIVYCLFASEEMYRPMAKGEK